jgi:hypothetical protein
MPVLIAILLAIPAFTQQISGERKHPLEASIISPETYLGGYLSGHVESAGGGRIVLRFTSLSFKGRTYPLEASVTGFVNSNGHAGRDDAGRPCTVENGAMAASPDLWLDEGVELKLLGR